MSFCIPKPISEQMPDVVGLLSGEEANSSSSASWIFNVLLLQHLSKSRLIWWILKLIFLTSQKLFISEFSPSNNWFHVLFCLNSRLGQLPIDWQNYWSMFFSVVGWNIRVKLDLEGRCVTFLFWQVRNQTFSKFPLERGAVRALTIKPFTRSSKPSCCCPFYQGTNVGPFETSLIRSRICLDS